MFEKMEKHVNDDVKVGIFHIQSETLSLNILLNTGIHLVNNMMNMQFLRLQ